MSITLSELGKVDVVDLYKRYAALQQKHGRILEALAVAVKREQEAVAKMEDMETRENSVVQQTRVETESKWKQAESDWKQADAEKNRMIQSHQSTILELESQLANRKIEEERFVQENGTLKSEVRKLQAQVSSESQKNHEVLKIKQLETEEKLENLQAEHAKVLAGLQTSRALIESVNQDLEKAKQKNAILQEQERSLLSQIEDAHEELESKFAAIVRLEEKLEENEVQVKDLSSKLAEANEGKRHAHLSVELLKGDVERLESAYLEMKRRVEEATMGNSRSTFGEFVEMKSKNKKLASQVCRMKKKLRDKSEKIEALQEASVGSSRHLSERRLVLMDAGPETEPYLGKPPVKMPTILSSSSNNNCYRLEEDSVWEMKPPAQNFRPFGRPRPVMLL